jgi:predicted dehydrogenase
VSNVRVAVIGVGHLGRIHARLLRSVAGAELAGVVDPMPEAREQAAAEYAAPAFADHTPLLGQIDAAIIATPSRYHHGVAVDLLRHGIHVFVEKPMTLNVGDADELIAEAAARNLVLQVGHVERFNPALVAAQPHVAEPKYIEAVRSGPFSCRSTDIGVVLDLMIHDIDVALALVGQEVVRVEALGAAVFGPNEDWAQARLAFAGGCVANLSASRVAARPQRWMQIAALDRFVSIDFADCKAQLMQPSEAVLAGEIDVNGLSPAEKSALKDRLFTDYLPLTELPVARSNALLDEQQQFLAAIRGQAQVSVTGRHGRQALDVAERILVAIASHRWEGDADGPTGPRHQSRNPILRGPHWHQAGRGDVRRKRAG